MILKSESSVKCIQGENTHIWLDEHFYCTCGKVGKKLMPDSKMSTDQEKLTIAIRTLKYYQGLLTDDNLEELNELVKELNGGRINDSQAV